MPHSFHVRLASPSQDPIVRHALRLLTQILKERAGVDVEYVATVPTLELAIKPRDGAEGYSIEGADGGLRIVGHDARGLLYGIGKFLHTSEFRVDGWSPTRWRGTSVPDCRMRGIYLANNFRNWNHASPVAELMAYLDELALWGMNTVAFCFPYYAGFAEPERSDYLARNRALIAHATAIGMRVGLLYAPNHGHGTLPVEIQASPFPDTTPARRGGGDNPTHFVCPSTPAGAAFIRERLAADMDCYAGLAIEFISTFPYDAGGCGCERCWPWGARGFVEMSRMVIGLARQRFTDCRLVLCTWCFDVREESDGEFDGLSEILATGNDWCDVIMTDAHGDFPRYPIEHGVPGGLPMINFAEISMWGRFPWGGSGANPFPRRIVAIWRQAKDLLDGGLPYSEGRFEDINKVTCLSLFWDREADADAIVRAYAHYEFGPASVNAVAEAVDLLEANYPSADLEMARANRILALLQEAEASMPKAALNRWRWRLLRLRAEIDVDTVANPDEVTVRRAAAYEELTQMYSAETAGGPVAPRSKSYYARPDTAGSGPRYAEHIGEHASDPSQIA